MAGVLEPLAEDDAESVAGVAGVACSRYYWEAVEWEIWGHR